MTELYLKASDVTIKRGQHAFTASTASIGTGLKRVDSVVATMDADPSLAPFRGAFVTAVKPAGGGVVTLKLWGDDLLAATVFGVGDVCNWIAIGPGA